MAASVQNRQYSRALERAVTDFGIDESFAKAAQKIKEHYKIDIHRTSIRRITEKHAACIQENKRLLLSCLPKQRADSIVAESDGSMVPVVLGHTDTAKDRRKTKILGYTEGRLSLAYKKGDIDPLYDFTFGSTDEVGCQIFELAKLTGKHAKSKIHCVSDGAPWIAEQVERVFGDHAKYLIDYYHMSEYLAKAAECCNPSDKNNWRRIMQDCMKQNQITVVLNELAKHIDANKSEDHVCSAKICYQYMMRRLNQFDYKTALEQGLPIGSGKIESGHRSIVQKRLKEKSSMILKRARFLILLDNVQDPRNLGAILRSSYCTGVDGVILCGKSSAPLNAAALKSSAGLAEHLDILEAPTAQAAVQELKKAGYGSQSLFALVTLRVSMSSAFFFSHQAPGIFSCC